MEPRIILHIDMNSYFASVEQQANPHLRGRPVGVCEHLGGIIIAPSVEAKRLGIKLGTPVWEAVKIFPQIVLLHTDPDKYRHTTRGFMKILHDYSDEVIAASIDEAFLDITKYCRKDYGDALLLGLEIKQRLRLEVGQWISASVGIGPNKLIAKIAADLDGGAIASGNPRGNPFEIASTFANLLRPRASDGHEATADRPASTPRNDSSFLDRICVIRREQIYTLYNCLGLTDVPGIGPRLERALHKLGIFSLRQLASYPLENLLNQFGIWGRVLHDLGNFHDTAPVITGEEPAKSFGHAYTVPKALKQTGEIKRLMFKLAEKVGRRMRKHGAAGNIVHYFHSTPSSSPPYQGGEREGVGFSKQRKIREFINDGKDIFKIAWGIYAQSEQAPVKIMGVSVSGLSFEHQEQEFLFEQYQRPRWLTAAMDKINDKYGDYTISRARFHDAPDDWAKDTAGFGRTRSNPR